MTPTFDPSQPFELVTPTATLDSAPTSPAVPDFDPTQDFELVDSPAKAPAFDESQPFEVIDDSRKVEAQAKALGTAYAIASSPIPGASLLKPVLEGKGGAVGDMALEVGLPILGGIAGAPGGPAGVAAGGAIGGAAGTSLRQIREQARGEREEFSTGQTIAGGVFGVVPLGKAAQVGGQIGKQIVRRGAQAAAIGVGNKAVEVAIDEQRLPTLGEAGEAAVTSGVFGGFLGAGEQAIANNAIKRTGNWIKTRFFPKAVLGEDIDTAIKDAGGAVKAEVFKAERRAADLEDVLRPMEPVTRERTANQVQAYLTGQLPLEQLPAMVRMPAQAMRSHIDELTDRAINEGVVGGKTAETFLNNRGTYLRRSYQLFADPDYRPSPKVFDAAVEDIMQTDGITRQEAMDVANELLDRGKVDSLLTGAGKRKDGKDVSSLMHKDDLRAPIRELLGEIKDPFQNYAATIPRMASLVEYDMAQRKIADIGETLGLFSRKSDPQKFTTRLANADNEKLNRYSGLWATPDVKAALENMGELPANGSIERALATATALSKASKTLLNPEGYAPNLIGSVVMSAANGHVGIHRGGDGVLLMAENLGFLKSFGKQVDRQRVRTVAEKLIRLRVLDSGISVNDLVGSVERGFTSNVRAASKYLLKPFGAVWQGSDNIAKLVAFQGERARYAKAFPQMTEDQLDDYAANVVRQTMPNYAEVPPWVRRLSERGIVQNFISFNWALYSNAYNIARIGSNDIRLGRETGNNALVAAGVKRLVPFTLALAASSPVGVSLASRTKAGMTSEDEEAARFLMPEWDSNGTLIWNGYSKGKELSYSNQSYVLPHSVLMQAAAAGMRGDDPVGAYVQSLGEQFLGGNIVIGPLAEAVTGRTRNGRPIGTPEAGPMQNIGERAGYALEEIFEPLAFRTAEKMEKAFTGEKGAYGEKYELADRSWRLAGVRKTRIDIPERMDHKASELSSRFEAATQFYRKQENRNLKPAELQDYYKRSETARRGVFDEMSKAFRYGQRLGMTEDQLIAAFKKAGAPSVVILNAMDGRYTPAEKGKGETAQEIYDRIRGLPEKQRREFIQKQEVGLARKLVEREVESAKGLTARQKLVLGLGVSDGTRARYIQSQLDQAESGQERQGMLREFIRIKALTPQVQGQIQQGGG